MNCNVPAPLAPIPNTYVDGVIPGLGVTSTVDVDGVIGGEAVKYTQDGAGQGNSAFLMGANGGPLVAAGPTGLIAYLTKVGTDWCIMSPNSCKNTQPAVAAQKYAAMLVAWLQAAPACAYKAGLTGSLYDNWGKPVDPYACPPGQSFDFLRGTCLPPPCPDGYTRASNTSPCEPPPASGEQLTPGRTQQSAPTGIVPVQTTPTNYNNGPYIQTVGGGGSLVQSSPASSSQTPFVSANLIPPSTLATAMITQTGLSMAVPSKWCALMGAMLGGFNCPSNLALSPTAPVTADVFLNALRQTESAQTAAPAITGGGFASGGGAPAPQVSPNGGVSPAAAPAGISNVGIAIAAAAVLVILLAKKAG